MYGLISEPIVGADLYDYSLEDAFENEGELLRDFGLNRGLQPSVIAQADSHIATRKLRAEWG